MDNYVSVIVPIHNAESYLEECLGSILNQTYNNIEVIMINDGSTDNSEKICMSYVQRDARFKYIYQSNMGVSEARKKGLSISGGKYVMYIDSDDYIDKVMIESLVNVAELNNSDIVECGVNKFSKISYLNDKIILKEENIQNNYEIVNNFLKRINTKDYLWNKIYKKKLLENSIITENYKHNEDYIYNLVIMANAKSKYTISECYYNYRRHYGSATLNKGFNMDKLDILNVSKKAYDITKNNYPELEIYSLYYLLDYCVGLYLEIYNSKYVIDSNIKKEELFSIVNDIFEEYYTKLNGYVIKKKKIKYIIFKKNKKLCIYLLNLLIFFKKHFLKKC